MRKVKITQGILVTFSTKINMLITEIKMLMRNKRVFDMNIVCSQARSRP